MKILLEKLFKRGSSPANLTSVQAEKSQTEIFDDLKSQAHQIGQRYKNGHIDINECHKQLHEVAMKVAAQLPSESHDNPLLEKLNKVMQQYEKPFEAKEQQASGARNAARRETSPAPSMEGAGHPVDGRGHSNILEAIGGPEHGAKLPIEESRVISSVSFKSEFKYLKKQQSAPRERAKVPYQYEQQAPTTIGLGKERSPVDLDNLLNQHDAERSSTPAPGRG